MFYAAFQLTSGDDSRLSDLYNTKLKLFLPNNKKNNLASISDAPYLCPYDATQHLSLAKLSDEDAAQQWQLQDDDLHLTQEEELVLDSNCRLRLGPQVPLHKDNNIDPTTTTTTSSKRGRFLVIYEQPLSDTSKPQQDQDIPVLLGPAEDEEEGGSCIDVLDCLIDSAVYQNDRSLVWISAWPDATSAVRYVGSIDRTFEDNVNLVRISRDYGISDRKEVG